MFFLVNRRSPQHVARGVKQPVVYILASKPYGTLYIGVTSKEHGVHTLVYFEAHSDMHEAIRAWRIRLIEEMNPEWRDLSAEAF